MPENGNIHILFIVFIKCYYSSSVCKRLIILFHEQDGKLHLKNATRISSAPSKNPV